MAPPPLDVSAVSSALPGWDVDLYVDESAERLLGSAVFGGLADRIGALPGIGEVQHEDRELFRLRTGLSPAAVERAAGDLLASLD